jgi:uncharacterized protein
MSAEFSLRLVPFFVVVALLQYILDSYVFLKWRIFLLERDYSLRWYSIARWCSWLMIILFPITVVLRQSQSSPSPLNRIFHYMLLVWYLPKVPVIIILLTQDITTYIAQYLVRLKLYNNPVVQSFLNRARQQIKPVGIFFTSRVVICFRRNIMKHNISDKNVEHQSEHISYAEQYTEKPHSNSIQTNFFFKRRALLSSLVKTSVTLVPMAALGHHAMYTLYDFQIHRIRIPMQGLPRQFDGITITQISDIHAGSFFSDEPMQEIRRIVHELKSDMLCITGDWVNWRSSELAMIMRELSTLCKQQQHPFGIWGCLGNHDHYASGNEHQLIVDTIRQAGVQLLINQAHTFSVDGAQLSLAGIDNIGLRQNFGDIPKALADCSPDSPTILMAHDPTVWDKYIRGKQIDGKIVNLMLSGHTHGGQFGVQAFGIEFSPVALMYKQSAGLYTDSDFGFGQHVYVNRGVGTTGIPLRIGIPPEITHITLHRA